MYKRQLIHHVGTYLMTAVLYHRTVLLHAHLLLLFEELDVYKRQVFFVWAKVANKYEKQLEEKFFVIMSQVFIIHLSGGSSLWVSPVSYTHLVSDGDSNPEEVLTLLEEYGISSRLTFSNSLLKKEHLSEDVYKRQGGNPAQHT